MRISKFFIVLILGLILGGCSVSKRAMWHVKKAEQLDPSIFKLDTIINKSIIVKLDTVIKLDTNINVILPRDTVKIEKLIPVNRNFNKVVKKQGIITTEAEAIKGMLYINSYLDSSFIYNLQTEITIKDAKIKELNTIVRQKTVIIEKQISWLKWLKIALIILIGLILLTLIIKIVKLFNG